MKQATFTDVRNNAKQYFDIVEAGESVRVLRNGKRIADIVPIIADLPSWKRHKAQPLVISGAAVSSMIIEARKAVSKDDSAFQTSDQLPKIAFARALPGCYSCTHVVPTKI